MTPRRCTRGKVLLFGVWLGQMVLLGMALAQGAPQVHELRLRRTPCIGDSSMPRSSRC